MTGGKSVFPNSGVDVEMISKPQTIGKDETVQADCFIRPLNNEKTIEFHVPFLDLHFHVDCEKEKFASLFPKLVKQKRNG